MTLYSTIFFLLPALLLSTTTATTIITSSAYDLVNQTCKNASMGDPNINCSFCIKAFQTSPSSRHANLTRLGLISINILKHNVMNTTCLIKNLLENKGEKKEEDEKGIKAGLKDCLELYSDSISTVGEAARDYRAQRMNDANVKISSVMDDSCTCEDGFHDVGVASPLTTQNNSTFQLSAIALSIMDMFSFSS